MKKHYHDDIAPLPLLPRLLVFMDEEIKRIDRFAPEENRSFQFDESFGTRRWVYQFNRPIESGGIDSMKK